MNRIAASTIAAALLILLLVSNGCGVNDNMEKMSKNTERLASQAEQYHSMLDATNKHMDRMASQFEQDQQYIKLLSETMVKLQEIALATTTNMDRMATQIEQDQQYIKVLSESLAKIEKIGTALFSVISDNLFIKTPPTKSDDIDDVLKGPKK